jgi:hypothetical protein
MAEVRGTTAVVEGRLDERLVERAIEAAGDAQPEDRIREAVEAVIDVAELDPEGTSEALWALRANREAVERLEASLDMSPERSTLALGAAVQLARSELAGAEPDLRSRMPELLKWLEGKW